MARNHVILVGRGAVLFATKYFADVAAWMQMASSVLEYCILATVTSGVKWMLVEKDSLGDLACMRMLETISKTKPGWRECQRR